jgi:hypothetical protein
MIFRKVSYVQSSIEGGDRGLKIRKIPFTA